MTKKTKLENKKKDNRTVLLCVFRASTATSTTTSSHVVCVRLGVPLCRFNGDHTVRKALCTVIRNGAQMFTVLTNCVNLSLRGCQPNTLCIAKKALMEALYDMITILHKAQSTNTPRRKSNGPSADGVDHAQGVLNLEHRALCKRLHKPHNHLWGHMERELPYKEAGKIGGLRLWVHRGRFKVCEWGEGRPPHKILVNHNSAEVGKLQRRCCHGFFWRAR